MNQSTSDKVFAGSVPELYDSHMVPLIFEPFAGDLARRVAALAPGRVLEIAAGTGALTRAMDAALPASVALVAMLLFGVFAPGGLKNIFSKFLAKREVREQVKK